VVEPLMYLNHGRRGQNCVQIFSFLILTDQVHWLNMKMNLFCSIDEGLH